MEPQGSLKVEGKLEARSSMRRTQSNAGFGNRGLRPQAKECGSFSTLERARNRLSLRVPGGIQPVGT